MSCVPGIVRGRNEDLDRLGGMVGGLVLTVPRLYVLAFGGVNAFMHCWSRTGGLHQIPGVQVVLCTVCVG